MYDDDWTPQVTGHETERGFAFTVEVRPPSDEDICEALARRMAGEYSIGEKMKAQVAERFAELVREMVDDTARTEIQNALQTPRQRTDDYGNPVGEPLSFQQMIAAQVAAWQEETVGYDGKPKKRDSYNSSSVTTRAEYLIQQVGAREFEKLAKEEVAKVRAQAKQLVESTIKNAVANSLSAMAK